MSDAQVCAPTLAVPTEKLTIKSSIRVVPWAIALVYALVSTFSRPSFGLTIFGDLAQLAIATILVAAFAANAYHSAERARWFWHLMTIGALFWLASQGVWTYYEVWKRVPPPDIELGGVLLFLHVAPMTAALVVMPHKRSGIPPLTVLSMGMIFTWWLFLYCYLVLPWQYVQQSPRLYSEAFNSLYTIEDLVFIGLLALWTVHARSSWRWLYVRLLAGSVVYTAGSVVLNRLIDQKHYYTGCLYDMLFIVPIAWIAYVAASFRPPVLSVGTDAPVRSDGRVGWFTLLALLSVPCLLLWNIYSNVPTGVREFRTLAGLIAIIILGLLLFAKQYVLSGRLSESLAVSEYNVSELLQLREQLEVKATHDSMTGLLNRSTVIVSLERELSRAAREDLRLAVLLLDLDHFKAINDNYGHHAGDTAIAFAATCMEQCVRSHDYVGRYGGEEFLIVITDCEEALAREIAERIRARMEGEFVIFDGHALKITSTIGLAISDPAETSESLLRRADAALYLGKQRGRNVVVCSPDFEVLSRRA
jgi:diguanylate cyclase (GGDEF)-like protein